MQNNGERSSDSFDHESPRIRYRGESADWFRLPALSSCPAILRGDPCRPAQQTMEHIDVESTSITCLALRLMDEVESCEISGKLSAS